MADAVAALKEAFGAFRKNIVGCFIYTLVFAFSCAMVLGIMFAITFVFGIITAGSMLGALFSGSSYAVSIILIGALFVLFLGMLILSWLLSGLIGSYFDALLSLMVARKPSIGGFFSGIPKRATPIFLAGVIQGLITFVPTFVITIIAAFVGFGSGIVSIFVQIITGLYSAIIGFLTIVRIAAVVVDGKGAISSLQHSVSLVSRNIISVVIYLILGFLLSLPILFAIGVPTVLAIFINNSLLQVFFGLGVLFSFAYVLFFFLPLMTLFNLSLYRKLK